MAFFISDNASREHHYKHKNTRIMRVIDKIDTIQRSTDAT